MLLDDNCLDYLANYQRLFIGYSGGLDSTVLLYYLATIPQLRDKLIAVHVHHGLSENADSWEIHCQSFCAQLNLPILTHRVQINKQANIEEQARNARYKIFSSLLQKQDVLLLAHHADDQAETLLLNLLRGAGVDGLAAMPVIRTMVTGELMRPFLSLSRNRLENYAHQHQLQWIEDESNQSIDFSRNYLRQRVMPLLKEKWPTVVNNLTMSATHCQQAKHNLNALAEIDLSSDLNNKMLSLNGLETNDPARIINVLRVWLMRNQVKLPSTNQLNHLVNDVIFAKQDAMPMMCWDNVVIKRYQQTLYLFAHEIINTAIDKQNNNISWHTFPHHLDLGKGRYLKALPTIKKGLQITKGKHISVRFRQGGETLHWNGKTQSLKKLLQQWHIPPWQRDQLPLIYVDDALVAVLDLEACKVLGCKTSLNQEPAYQLFFNETCLSI